MFFVAALLSGLIVGAVDSFIIRREKKAKSILSTLAKDTVSSNLFGFLLAELLCRLTGEGSIYPLSVHSVRFYFLYSIITLFSGFIVIFLLGIFDSFIFIKHTEKSKKTKLFIKIFFIVFVFLGLAAYTGTIWGKDTFGNLAADQLIINLITPKEGTSDDIMTTLFEGPVLQTISITAFLSLFVFSSREFYLKGKDKDIPLFSSLSRNIISIFLSLVILFGGCSYGIIKFNLEKVFKMYFLESKFIENNYVDPQEVKLQFPETKRNLIHIYLESMENSYATTDMGGYMDENLIEPLTNLAKEGYSFSHLYKGLGGPIDTVGCTWSVASMVNMNAGIPMKVPTGGNEYGAVDNFMPGAITLGDILESQGYEQTLMFGATAKFGGLNFFYESHGDFSILDYDRAKEKGWIPDDYKVWWGYEDDKLYEFAKKELTRLSKTGKPFNFVMETADTHFPDGYVSPNTPTPRESQYANVIAHSASETEMFVRWIQQQPFYENTTIVIIGDHLSMDTKFFENFDETYLRTTFNLILNPASTVTDIPKERMQNRWWYNGDMFPTILASIGVKIEGDRLALGTNLFSDTPTLFEENGGKEGWEFINKEFEYGSKFYAKNILIGNNEAFDTKNVTEYKN